MPYHAERSEKCPMTRPFAVVKDGTGEVMGCHPSEAAANDQVAALYASERETMREADSRYGTHGHAIMHPDRRIQAKAARYVDGQLPDLPPVVE